MKRVLASILMTAVLLLSLLVPAGAGHLISEPNTIVPLWSADENWDTPFGFVVDRENQVEGEGCVSIELGKNATFIAQIKLPEVDATGMRYLEFDVYVSDLAILEAWLDTWGDSVGISSSGQPDRAEKRVHFHEIAKQSFVKGCPRVGWNHVAIPLDQMSDIEGAGGKLDLSQVNFLRIFIISWSLASVPEAKDWVLKFDNFALTDRQVAPDPHTPGEWQYDENKHWRYCTECDKKLDETFHSEYSHPPYVFDEPFTCYACKQECAPLSERGKYAELIGKIEQLSLVCEDTSAQEFDLDAVKAQYDALMTEWNALSADEQSMLKANGYYKLFTNVKKAIADCEEINYILKENESLISDLLWLKDHTLMPDLNIGNYEQVRDLTRKTRATFNNLKRTVKAVLTDQGYLAILEAAEAALSIHTHRFTEQGTWYLAQEASCAGGAKYYYRCSICGLKDDKHTFEIGEPVPGVHAYGEWEEIRIATEKQNGLKQRQCLGCSHTETQEVVYVPFENPDDDGCSSVLVSGAPAMLALIAVAGWMLRKKKK